MKLTQTDFSRPIDTDKPPESEQKPASEQARDIKLVYKGDTPSAASEKISEPKSSVTKQAR